MKESKKTNTGAIPFVRKDLPSAEVQEEKILAELEAKLKTLELPRREIPSALDRAVLSYAAESQKKRSAGTQSIRFIRKYILGLAAALAVCVSLTFLLKEQAPPQQVTSLTGGTVYLADDQDMMNVELLLLSSSIRNSSERLTRTAALSAALDMHR